MRYTPRRIVDTSKPRDKSVRRGGGVASEGMAEKMAVGCLKRESRRGKESETTLELSFRATPESSFFFGFNPKKISPVGKVCFRACFLESSERKRPEREELSRKAAGQILSSPLPSPPLCDDPNTHHLSSIKLPILEGSQSGWPSPRQLI